MWCILDSEGNVLGEFDYSQDAYEATYTGEFPEDCEVAYIATVPGQH